MKDVLRRLFGDLLPRLDPGAAVAACLGQGELLGPEPVVLVAFGKAAGPMARAACAALGEQVRGGVYVAPEADDGVRVEFARGDHPFPDRNSFAAGQRVLDLLTAVTAGEQVLFLVSGGGSAMIEQPLDRAITPGDLHTVHRLLVECGADIVAMNAVRKHLSAVKGGRLARAARAAARQLTLFLSDVPPGHPDAVASGPTLPDPTTVADVRRTLVRWSLEEEIPGAVRGFLAGQVPETPKDGDPCFSRARWQCLMDNDTALGALAEDARGMGWRPVVDRSWNDRPIAEAVQGAVARVRALGTEHPGRTVCLLTGGELSCPVRGGGVGGRNLEFALRCAQQIEGEGIAVLSCGTDGIDGNAPAAGGVVDGGTTAALRAAGIDPAAALADSDAYSALARVGGVVVTGPTGTNVRDVRVLVAW